MRSLIAVVLLLLGSLDAKACDCFPPEMRDKVAQDALATARVAVYAKVMEFTDIGQIRLLVIESFKGPSSGTVLDAMQGSQCADRSFQPGEEVLILSQQNLVSACDKYPRDNFMVESFRRIKGK